MINKDLLIEVIEELKKRNLSIGAVESFTGGLFSSTLTSVSGVSQIFKGSIVSYSSLIKEKFNNFLMHKLIFLVNNLCI